MAIISTMAIMAGATIMEPLNFDEALKDIENIISGTEQVLKQHPDDLIAEMLLYSAKKLKMRLEDAKQKGYQ